MELCQLWKIQSLGKLCLLNNDYLNFYFFTIIIMYIFNILLYLDSDTAASISSIVHPPFSLTVYIFFFVQLKSVSKIKMFRTRSPTTFRRSSSTSRCNPRVSWIRNVVIPAARARTLDRLSPTQSMSRKILFFPVTLFHLISFNYWYIRTGILLYEYPTQFFCLSNTFALSRNLL